jgi:hypothetical protein
MENCLKITHFCINFFFKFWEIDGNCEILVFLGILTFSKITNIHKWIFQSIFKHFIATFNSKIQNLLTFFYIYFCSSILDQNSTNFLYFCKFSSVFIIRWPKKSVFLDFFLMRPKYQVGLATLNYK